MSGYSLPDRGLRTVPSALLATVLLFSCSKGFHKPIDVTEDSHHRVLAEIFLPDREPMVFRLFRRKGLYGEERGAPETFLRIQWDQYGAFLVESDEKGYVIMYSDKNAAYGHIQVAAARKCKGISRIYTPYPKHPVGRPDVRE